MKHEALRLLRLAQRRFLSGRRGLIQELSVGSNLPAEPRGAFGSYLVNEPTEPSDGQPASER